MPKVSWNYFPSSGGNTPQPPPIQELVVLVGASEVAYTDDGVIFYAGSAPPWTNSPSSVSYDGVGFCAIEFNTDNYIYTTLDGNSWGGGVDFVLSGGDNNTIASNNVRYVITNPSAPNGNVIGGPVAGPLGNVLVQGSSLFPMAGIACNPGVTPYAFACVGFDGVTFNLAWSVDGENWNTNNNYFGVFSSGIFRANNRFFYVDGATIGTFENPNDPPSEVVTGLDLLATVTNIVHDGTYYVASNTLGEIARCTDPINGPWSVFNGPDEPNSLRIAALTGIIIGLSLNGNNDVFTSLDGGETWSGVVHTGDFAHVCGAR